MSRQIRNIKENGETTDPAMIRLPYWLPVVQQKQKKKCCKKYQKGKRCKKCPDH